MYHTHFGLERGLFGDGIAADTAVFRSPKHDQIIAHFKLALGSPSSVVVLRGPAGVGKTTLTSTALRASSTRLALAWLNATPTNAAELLELVLVELGVATARASRIERLQLWRQFQAENRATESRLFVVVERTEDLSPEVLHALDSLTAADAAGNLGANVVLLGHAGIDAHLGAPILESLRQRIRLRAELTPFTEAELQDYLRHQVACAGGHYDHVFAPGTIAALFRHSGGVARLVNTLCATALELAATDKHTLLTAELVRKTAVSVLGLAEAPAAHFTAPAVNLRASVLTAATTIASFTPVAPAAPFVPVVKAAAPAVAAAPPQQSAATATPAATPARATPAAIPPPAVAVAPLATPAPPPSAPALAPTTTTPTSMPTPAPATAAKAPPLVEFEYDGEATDITDVAMADFPVLTDAVELPTPSAVKRAAVPAPPPSEPLVTAATKPAPARPSPLAAAAPIAAPPPAAAKPSVSSRIETAYTAPKTPPTVKPADPAATTAKPATATAPSAPAASKLPAPAAPVRVPAVDPDNDDLLRQTQTMRAIAVAKSIDDISSSMAETLFGDAELDLVTAALASAAEWPDDEQPAAATAADKSEPPQASAPVDDPFDLFGLGDDAPLELIDDSAQPPAGDARKTATR